MMHWTEVEAQLCGRAEEVARYLLPAGKREGPEWVCGSVEGRAGRSLKVNTASKAGVWSDFAGTDKGRTFLSLWCAVRRKEFRECIREAKDFLGIRDDYERRITTPRPAQERDDESKHRAVLDTWAKCQPPTEGGPVWHYLVDIRRIAPEAIAAYDVREYISYDRWAMVFPYYPPPPDEKEVLAPTSKVPAWLKFELLDRPGGKKKEWTSKEPEKSLFGAHLLKHPLFSNAKNVLICEGEKDALTWTTYGCFEWGALPVSVPFGAKWKGQDKTRPSPNREWLDRSWDWMMKFDFVFVAMDSDDAGRKAALDIIHEIGPRRCRLVELPPKMKEAAA